MEKASSSAKGGSSRAKASDAQKSDGCLGVLSEDLLHNILARLPALSFASAACVCRSWNLLCNRFLSRPKLSSALSLNPSLPDAVNEVIQKVLSEPIRPHFAIANVGSEFDLSKILQLIREILGFNIPIIVSVASGIIGRDALTDEFKEVKWGALFSGFGGDADARTINEGIVLTVGYLPGLKIEAIPLLRPPKSPQASAVDNFVMNIKECSASVSGSPFPVGIILFGEGRSDMKPVLEKLDYAMPMNTVIVGDERSCFIYRSGNDSRKTCGRKGDLKAVALVFAQDRDGSSGNIRFHVALSNGVSAVGARYKTGSVRISSTESSTWLTARREGQQEVLDGQSILDDINNLVCNS